MSSDPCCAASLADKADLAAQHHTSLDLKRRPTAEGYEVHRARLREGHAGARALHAIAKGWAGPSLLAMIVFEKFGQHQPLNRQGRALRPGRRADRAVDHGGRRGIGLRGARADPSPGGAHVLAAERLHGDRYDRARTGRG